MPREVFVDAGAWIALAVEPDTHHAAALPTYQHLAEERVLLVTTNLVVAEAYVLIHRHGGHRAALTFLHSLRRSPRVLKVFSDSVLEDRAEEILARYDDQDFSLADAVSFALMEVRGISEAFAFDRHFLIAGFALIPMRDR